MGVVFDSIVEVGIPEIDGQHREIHRRVAQLLSAMAARQGRTAIGPMIDYLATYALEHFASEEALMQQRGYPDFARHQAHHQQFVADLDALRREHDADGPSPHLVIRFSSWITGWLRDHIYKVDKRMADFIMGAS
jgi:hemerythrin